MPPAASGGPWRRFLRSFVFAARGIVYAFRTQRNLRIHFLATTVALLLAVWLRFSPEELAIVVMLCGGVIALELVNTAVEAAVDVASPHVHPLAGAAKDTAAGAVLVAAVVAVVVGLLLYTPRLLQRLAGV